MITPPRVAFSMFHSERDPMLLAWGRFRSGIPGSAVAPPPIASAAPVPGGGLAPRATESPGGVWRLLASNNREVARSAHVYRSFEAAHRHVLELQSAPSFDVELVRGPVAGMRGWVITIAGRPSMTCSRWYSATACAESARSAVELFRTAVVSEGWRWSTGGPARFGDAGAGDGRRPLPDLPVS